MILMSNYVFSDMKSSIKQLMKIEMDDSTFKFQNGCQTYVLQLGCQIFCSKHTFLAAILKF
jgi:hypothetical protein